MKILMYSSYFIPYVSGMTIYNERLIDHLRKKHQITVVTFPHTRVGEKMLPKKNLRIQYLPFLFRVSKGFISPQSLYYFLKHVFQTDVVFINIPNAEALPLALFAKLLGKPVISIYHCEVMLPKSFFSSIVSFFLRVSIFLQMFFSDRIIGYTNDYVLSTFFGKVFSKKMEYILPPIISSKADRTYYASLQKKKKEKWIGFSGRISREKGIEHLISAAVILKQKGVMVRLVFAGPFGNAVVGEESYFTTILSRLKKENIEHRFLGSLPQDRLSAFYRAIDVLVLPSVNKTEAFGLVQAEAMMQGTPVVASDLPGVRVPILMTKMGKITPVGMDMDLAENIAIVLRNKSAFIYNDEVKELFKTEKTYDFFTNLLRKYE